MRTLVDDLISLSRIEAERFAAPSDPVDLLRVVQYVRDSLAELSKARGSEILIENEARATLVPGERAQLAQLISNLVTNALNYGRAGAPVRVKLEEAGGGLLRVRVIDQGEGIAPEHLPRLTERFYRIDAGRSRSVGGTGLGLAIAKHIALRHRGRLEIVSKQGEGTSVRVYCRTRSPGAYSVLALGFGSAHCAASRPDRRGGGLAGANISSRRSAVTPARLTPGGGVRAQSLPLPPTRCAAVPSLSPNGRGA